MGVERHIEHGKPVAHGSDTRARALTSESSVLPIDAAALVQFYS